MKYTHYTSKLLYMCPIHSLKKTLRKFTNNVLITYLLPIYIITESRLRKQFLENNYNIYLIKN